MEDAQKHKEYKLSEECRALCAPLLPPRRDKPRFGYLIAGAILAAGIAYTIYYSEQNEQKHENTLLIRVPGENQRVN